MLEMQLGKSQGDYTVERMIQMATISQTADGLEISGNSFKATALTGCPDMVLFACEEILALHQVLTEIKELNSDVSEFIENLDCVPSIDETKAFNKCLEISNKISDLNLPDFI